MTTGSTNSPRDTRDAREIFDRCCHHVTEDLGRPLDGAATWADMVDVADAAGMQLSDLVERLESELAAA